MIAVPIVKHEKKVRTRHMKKKKGIVAGLVAAVAAVVGTVIVFIKRGR